jgi:hypothetical protein
MEYWSESMWMFHKSLNEESNKSIIQTTYITEINCLKKQTIMNAISVDFTDLKNREDSKILQWQWPDQAAGCFEWTNGIY